MTSFDTTLRVCVDASPVTCCCGCAALRPPGALPQQVDARLNLAWIEHVGADTKGMVRDRREERWAALCVGAVLGVELEANDDGSAPGMHDLDILFADRAPGVVEVTADADPRLIQLWKLVNDRMRLE
jgi:hypothetical protein